MKPIISVILALFLSACSTTPSSTQDQLKSGFFAPADKALVVIFRPKTFVSGGYKPHFYINGQHIIRSKSGRYTTAIVEPGSAIFSILSPREYRRYPEPILAKIGLSAGDAPEEVRPQLEADLRAWADVMLRAEELTINVKAGIVYYVDWGPGRDHGQTFALVKAQDALAEIAHLKRDTK